MSHTLAEQVITNLGDTEKADLFKIDTFTLPTSDPWVVEVNGDLFTVPSTIGLLLLHLAKKPKKATKS